MNTDAKSLLRILNFTPSFAILFTCVFIYRENKSKWRGNFISTIPKITLGKDTQDVKITYAKKFDDWNWIIAKLIERKFIKCHKIKKCHFSPRISIVAVKEHL
jgi:hypothetical protein